MSDAAALRESAVLLWVQGEVDRAIAEIDRAVALDPKDARAFLIRANMYIQKREYVRAIADLDRLVELMPNNIAGFYLRAGIHAVLNNSEQAMADYKRALELKPRNSTERLMQDQSKKRIQALSNEERCKKASGVPCL